MDFYRLEVFQEQIPKLNMITNKIKKIIKQEALAVYPNECCGFVVEKDNEHIVIPCENIAKNKFNDFMISAKDFLNIKEKHNILWLYHNHTDIEDFSLLDKKTADNLSINLLLYINKLDEFKVFYHKDFKNLNYLFKPHDDYKNNCFNLIKNYFKNELNLNLEIDNNLINTKKIEDLNVEEIALNNYQLNNLYILNDKKNIKKNDILLLNDRISDHLAVYLGNNKILHQPIHKVSIIEDYTDKYKKQTKLIFRSNLLYDNC